MTASPTKPRNGNHLTLTAKENKMQVHFINSGFGTDDGVKEVEVHSLKIDGYDRPYAIVEHPYVPGDSCRAEFTGTKWVVDFD